MDKAVEQLCRLGFVETAANHRAMCPYTDEEERENDGRYVNARGPLVRFVRYRERNGRSDVVHAFSIIFLSTMNTLKRELAVRSGLRRYTRWFSRPRANESMETYNTRAQKNETSGAFFFHDDISRE